MRACSKPRPVLRGAFILSCFLWTLYSHMSLRSYIGDSLHQLEASLRELEVLELPVTRLTRVNVLEEAVTSRHLNNYSDTFGTASMEELQSLLFQRDFETGDSTFVEENTYDKQTVWLYSLITTDFDGSSLIPHFLRHYTQIGLRSHKIYVDLLHNPALSDEGLLLAQQQFQSAGVHTRLVLHAYTPHLQDLAMISGLSKIPMQPEDWVIACDMDEYFTFTRPGSLAGSVQEAAQAMEEEGASFALGEMLDHVALGGALNRVDRGTDIWSQFPLVCPIVSSIAHGLAAKVTMHKAYLRSGAGHHHIVEPYLAEAYFGSQCTGVQCELVMKRYKQRSTEDVYELTPYYQYADRFARSAASPGWQAKRWRTWSKVHHFKWHRSVLDNLLSRMVRDSGNCQLGINENHCKPVFQFWQEVARQFQQLNQTKSINITGLDCAVGIDTFWNWEEEV